MLLAPWCLFGCFVRTQGTVPCVHLGVLSEHKEPSPVFTYAASAVVDILRAGAAGDRGNALQAVGVAGQLPVLGSRDDHAVTI